MMTSSDYLRLLIFLPANLIPACTSFSLAFHMMYPAYKLNKQGDNIMLGCIHIPIWNQSIISCLVLSVVASLFAYRFLRRKVKWCGSLISFKNFQQFTAIHILTGFGLVNEAEVDLFFL